MHTAHKKSLGFAWQQLLHDIFSAGLAAVAPDAALKAVVSVEPAVPLGSHTSAQAASAQSVVLRIADETFVLGRVEKRGREDRSDASGRLLVVGAGKGAAPMAQALEHLVGEYISAGHVIVKYDHGLEVKHIRLSEAAHPVPDAAGESATREMLALAHDAREGDLVLCLLTGGASALTPAPVMGISLADVQRTTALLLGSGASIHELNAVRKHLSVFSGGQLARAAQPARVVSLIVSDVVGDNLDVIASGPTAPDESTFADCLAIIEGYALADSLPPAVMAHIRAGVAGQVPETPKASDPLWQGVRNHLVATLGQAMEAAAQRATALGFSTHILTCSLTGEAKHVAVELIATARAYAAQLEAGSAPVCLLAGGETTVTLAGLGAENSSAVKGGRNQEMALAASIALQDVPNMYALFAGTDGSDGPTDAAGGFACGEAVACAMAAGYDAHQCLTAHTSYNFLEGCQRLLKTGPTRTNVMDMSIVLVYPPA